MAEAQHVILVEPLLNPGAEAQVVGRVHRIGQTQKTYVHSFVTRNTVEENVYQLNRERAANVDVSTIAGTKVDAAKEDQNFSARWHNYFTHTVAFSNPKFPQLEPFCVHKAHSRRTGHD